MRTDFQIPPDVSFQDAIALTQTLLTDGETLPPAKLESHVSALVNTMNGARGFFVTFLTNEFNQPEPSQGAIVRALRTSPEIVAGLLVKNLVMSTAMILTHRRQDHPKLAQQSQLTQEQTATLIQQLQLPDVEQEAQQLWQSLTTEGGTYIDFLQRWGYDAEQKQAMQAVLSQTFPVLSA